MMHISEPIIITSNLQSTQICRVQIFNAETSCSLAYYAALWHHCKNTVHC